MNLKKMILIFTVLAGCLFSIDTGADEPEKRVMNFIAVMDLKCGKGIDADVCNSFTDIIIGELVKIGKYTVIDRANRDKILSEQGFQQTGCVKDSCTVEAGQLLGVGKLVVGSITKIGQTYLINLQLINVQTASVEISSDEECKCELDGLIQSVRNATRKLMGQVPSQVTPSQTQPQAATVKPGEMVSVPAGEFIMGSDSGEADEKPVHKVYLDAFQIDKYEVTNEQYQQCVNEGPCSAAHFDDGSCAVLDGSQWHLGVLPQSFRGSNQPVVCVDWNQSDTYCKWTGKRLPTEAEWEKAARGTDGRTYPWGEGIDCTRANFKDCNQGKTKPVGSYSSGASPYGAFDMSGNVLEHCSDWYDEKYYSKSPSRNPKGSTSGQLRSFRGGSWYAVPLYLRAPNRSWYDPSLRSSADGFRCARTP